MISMNDLFSTKKPRLVIEEEADLKVRSTAGYAIIREWLSAKGHQPFLFQEQTWEEIIQGKSGLVNAPTGCGKTFSVFLGAIIDFINHHPTNYQTKIKSGLQLIWITPLRALAKDIGRAMEEVITALNMNWKVGIRNGDTTMSDRAKQKRQMPEVLIITPESLHLLLAQKNYPLVFTSLKILAVDEWHELLGSKRGVQVELAVSRIVSLRNIITAQNAHEKPVSIWGISATIGNLEQAKDVLLATLSAADKPGKIVKAIINKNITY